MQNSDRGHMGSLLAEQVGSLVARLAHDLRQPLTTIETAAYCLGLILPCIDSRAREQLETLFQQVDIANHMVADAVEQLRTMEAQALVGAPAAEESRSLTKAAMAAVTY